jgi:KipI family sensor histidine kinase inhibitor
VSRLGDQAVLLVLEGDPDQCNRRIARLATTLLEQRRAGGWGGVVDVVPAMVSLAVFYDGRGSPEEIERGLLQLAGQHPDLPADDAPGSVHLVPVVYDGPDLLEVASRLQVRPAELVRRHAAAEYRVRFLGFAPGFAYLGPLDSSLVVARRPDPRRRVPAGSVAVAGDQTAIYPLDTPGGWHIIGRTTVRPFDLSRSPPNLFAPGDRVRFEPVTA